MKNLDRRLAVLCLVAGAVLLAAGLGLALVNQSLSGSAAYALLAGVALLICYGVLAPAAVMELLRTRQARFGSLSVLVTAGVLGILVLVNVLASRAPQSVDLTRAHLYTLSPKSVTVVKRLDSDLTVTGFFRPGQNDDIKRQDQSLLAEYQKVSPRVKVSFVNPDLNPALANKLGVRIDASLAIQYKDRTPIVLSEGSQAESDITSAILKLEAAKTPVICWAAGEGQRDLGSTQPDGYATVAGELSSDNFTTRPLVLSQLSAIPGDCDVLAIVGPTRALSAGGQAAIGAYLSGGGRLLLALDPWLDKSLTDSYNAVLAPYGSAFDGGLVIETDPAHYAQGNPDFSIVFSYGGSPITKDLNNKGSVFLEPTAIRDTGAGGATSVELAQTTKGAYEIAQPRTNLNDLSRHPGDAGGPFTLMRTLEKQSGSQKTRLVLVGTSAVSENGVVPPAGPGYNDVLFTDSFDWLAGNDALISLPAKPPAAAPLNLTQQDLVVNLLVTIVLLPALVAGIGVAVWARRRTSFRPAA